MLIDEGNSDSALCCCEYIDRRNKRYHVLGCCCNCEDFDIVCTRLVTCKAIDSRNRNEMLIAFQDRLRIPWHGGAKHISPEAVVPAIIVPVVLALAAINGYVATIMLLSTIGFLGYGLHRVRMSMTRTRFFISWNFWSVLYMALIYQLTVPLLELLPEENFILVLLSVLAMLCFICTIKLAPSNHVTTQSTPKDELPGITEATSGDEEEEEQSAHTALLLENEDVGDAGTPAMRHQPNICKICRKYMPPRTSHCSMCGGCILRRDHHSFWLNCCIGQRNHCMYLLGMLIALFALLLGANLVLTAICHPFLIVRFLDIPLMLPDDCSEVFNDYELGISFVAAVYALLIAIYILVALLRQLYFISRGSTMQECQRGHCGNRKSFWFNWKSFIY